MRGGRDRPHYRPDCCDVRVRVGDRGDLRRPGATAVALRRTRWRTAGDRAGGRNLGRTARDRPTSTAGKLVRGEQSVQPLKLQRTALAAVAAALLITLMVACGGSHRTAASTATTQTRFVTTTTTQ